jgi:DNA repair protein RadA/Sms
VLERRANLHLSDSDVYVSTVGGIRLTEPGADLAIALAIASAYKNKAFPATLAAVGEISLAGEIRPVSQAKQRVAEAGRLGFATVLDAESGLLIEALRRGRAGRRSAVLGSRQARHRSTGSTAGSGLEQRPASSG